MLRHFSQHTGEVSDEDLVDQYKSTGDLSCLGVLYERYTELVYGVCLKYLKETSLAEDAAMDIFETLVEKVKTQEIRTFRPWLYVLAKNHCLMQLRKKNRTVSYDNMVPSAQAEVMQKAGAVHPLYEFESNGEEAALKSCIEQLSEVQRDCIKAFYFNDKSYKEIATESGQELGMVRSNIQNGRRNLRNCMEKKGKGVSSK